MGITATSAKEIVIGAGDIVIDGVDYGATEGKNIFRVQRTIFTPKINGIPGHLMGTDYIQEEHAEIEFGGMQLGGAKLETVIPGSIITPGDAMGTPAGGGQTTLAADTAVGDVIAKVTAVSGITQGDVVAIGVAGSREFRVVESVGTAGAGGTGLDLDAPLTLVHHNTDPCLDLVSTTLAVDAPPGSVVIHPVSVAGVAAGDFVRVGYSGNPEVRQITIAGTGGAGGTGLQFATPLASDHREGDPVVRQTDAGATVATSATGTTRRIPLTSYHDVQLRVPGLVGLWIFDVRNALNIDPGLFEVGDDGAMVPRLKMQSRWDGANPTVSPWSITPAAAAA